MTRARISQLPRWVWIGVLTSLAYAALGQLSLWTWAGGGWFVLDSWEEHLRFILRLAFGIGLLCVLLTAVERHPRNAKHAAYAIGLALTGGIVLHLILREIWLDGGCWSFRGPNGFFETLCMWEVLPPITRGPGSIEVIPSLIDFVSIIPIVLAAMAAAFVIGVAIQRVQVLVTRRQVRPLNVDVVT